jgi:hypothetical protein
MNRRPQAQTLLYILALVGVLFGIYFVYQLLTAGLQAYLALIAGVMLVIGNLPELARALQQRTLSAPLHNTLIGLALICYFIGSIIAQMIFWPLSIVMLFAALPLTLNRAPIARAYLNGARNLASQARHLIRIRQRTL